MFGFSGITYHRCNPSKKGNLLTYETHPFTFGIDIKNLDYIKHPTPAVSNINFNLATISPPKYHSLNFIPV